MNVRGISQARAALEVFLGSKELSLDQIATIGEGSIVELDSIAGEPVEVRIAGRQVAFGEVVVIDESFGVRITQILNQQERNE